MENKKRCGTIQFIHIAKFGLPTVRKILEISEKLRLEFLTYELK